MHDDKPQSRRYRNGRRVGRRSKRQQRRGFHGVGDDFALTETAKGFGFIPSALRHPKRTFYNLSGLIGLVALLCVGFEGVMYGLQSPADRATYRPFLLQHITFTGVDGIINLKNGMLKSLRKGSSGGQATPPPDEYKDGEKE